MSMRSGSISQAPKLSMHRKHKPSFIGKGKMSMHQKKSMYKPDIEIEEGQSDNDYGNEDDNEDYGSDEGFSVESFLYMS